MSTDYLVRIYKKNHSECCGRLEHLQSGQSIAFNSLLEMLLLLHTGMEQSGLPHSHLPFRRWQRKT